MNKIYFNHNEFIKEFFNENLKNAAIKTHFSGNVFPFNKKEIACNEFKNSIYNEKYINEKLLNESFLFVVYNNKLKIVQYSNKYIMDDLLNIDNFLKNYNKELFLKNLSKTYFVSKKIKAKYIKKAIKGKETIYYNSDIGSNILNYINNKKDFNYLGDRFGLENWVLDNLRLEDPNFLESKFIIIMNFDCDIIELYESIPYELLQKGTANLECDSIYGCYFKDFNYQSFFNKIK